MQRGPMALFGAIIAVGLGPALWLGAQWGELPAGPPAVPVTNVVDQAEVPVPGQGAADTESVTDDGQRNRRPAGSTRSAEPAKLASRPASPSPSVIVSISPSASPEISESPAAAPSESPPPITDPSPSPEASPSAAAVPGPLIQAGVAH